MLIYPFVGAGLEPALIINPPKIPNSPHDIIYYNVILIFLDIIFWWIIFIVVGYIYCGGLIH